MKPRLPILGLALFWIASVALSRAQTKVPQNIIIFLDDDIGMGDTSVDQDWAAKNPDSAQISVSERRATLGPQGNGVKLSRVERTVHCKCVVGLCRQLNPFLHGQSNHRLMTGVAGNHLKKLTSRFQIG